MQYFDEPVGRVKIQTTSKNIQRYYTPKRLIRDLLSNDFFSQNSDLPKFWTSLGREEWGEYKYLLFVLVSRDICTLGKKQSWIIIKYVTYTNQKPNRDTHGADQVKWPFTIKNGFMFTPFIMCRHAMLFWQLGCAVVMVLPLRRGGHYREVAVTSGCSPMLVTKICNILFTY